jgi:Holliday junction resolvasome RuvABC ATP-dependent DNA helicase subunit
MQQSHYFEGIIGQEKVKRKLSLYIDGYKKTSLLPNLLFEGAQGSGKTHLCYRVAELLQKDWYDVNGATIKNVKEFINNILMEVSGKKALIFIDEFHAVPHGLNDLLLTVTNPNLSGVNTFNFEGSDIEIDRKLISFIFATTERQKIFKPLLGRLTPISLAAYTLDELASIIRLNAPKVRVATDAASVLSTYTRGTARSAVLMGQEIQNYSIVMGRPVFTTDMVPELMDILDIFPLGLTEQEVMVLAHIRDSHGGITLTALSSKTHMTKPSQQDAELYLQKQNLMRIEGKRVITQEGINYLQKVGR